MHEIALRSKDTAGILTRASLSRVQHECGNAVVTFQTPISTTASWFLNVSGTLDVTIIRMALHTAIGKMD